MPFEVRKSTDGFLGLCPNQLTVKVVQHLDFDLTSLSTDIAARFILVHLIYTYTLHC